MNWRGRPLTSHEVVVNTIASAHTRTGLRVHAELDTRDYPLGIAINTEQFQALPVLPHDWHGAWNYTVHPASAEIPATAERRAHHRAEFLKLLTDPRLTGMTRDELADLAAGLAPAQAARAAQRCWEQRGGRRRRAPGAGGKRLLTDAACVLITILYLRQVCSQRVLSELLEVNPNTIGEVIADTRTLLDQHRVATSTRLRFTTPAAFRDFLHHTPVPRAQPPAQLSERLSSPTLTGLSRRQLHALVERLAPRQAASVERHRHTRRGGERMPGARGGVFLQKITDADRVLATVLHQRRLCNREVLAELFGVSPRTIGTALLQVRPLLEHDGITITTATTRYRSAADLLAAIPPPDTIATDSTR